MCPEMTGRRILSVCWQPNRAIRLVVNKRQKVVGRRRPGCLRILDPKHFRVRKADADASRGTEPFE
jgi:hypothetical protein